MSEGFPSIALSAVASITMGQSPGAETYSSEENGLPFLQGCAEFGALHPQPEIYCELPLRVAKKDSILISVRAPVGTMNLADQDYCIGRGLGAVQGIAGKANTSFLRYAIAQNVGFLHRRSQGSTFLAISSGELRLLPIPDIGFRTQGQIAEVLSTLDKAIEKTEALIDKYQQIKAGLMHDLFTRGVTADSKLRPPRDQAPELYRETPIGWIPKEWEVKALRGCLVGNPTNGIYKPPTLIGQGILLVGQTAFTLERSIDFALARRAVLSKDEHSHYGLMENDILVTRVFATVEGVGLPTLVPAMYELAVYESNMMRLRVERTVILPVLLFEWLRSHNVRKMIVSGANASNQTSINQRVLNLLPVPRPLPEEQHRMVKIIKALDTRIKGEKSSLGKLCQQKSGLMSDLLTGKVRVRIYGQENTI